MTITEFVKFADAVTGSKKSLDKINQEVDEINKEYDDVKAEYDGVDGKIAERVAKMREETKKSVATYMNDTDSYKGLPEWLKSHQSSFSAKDSAIIGALFDDDSISPVDVAHSLAMLRPMIFVRYLTETLKNYSSELKDEYNELLIEKERLSAKLEEVNNRKSQCNGRKARNESAFASQKVALVRDMTIGDLKGLEKFYELNILHDLIETKVKEETAPMSPTPPPGAAQTASIPSIP